MSSLMKMGGRVRMRRPLTLKRSCTLSRARQIVAQGLVNTGSEWDGWHIRDVYKAISEQVRSKQRAWDLTKAIWENRAVAFREGKVDYEAATRKDEPWSCDPEPSYFEDEEVN